VQVRIIIGTSLRHKYSQDKPNSEEVEELVLVDGGYSMLMKVVPFLLVLIQLAILGSHNQDKLLLIYSYGLITRFLTLLELSFLHLSLPLYTECFKHKQHSFESRKLMKLLLT
jgi:hypothetical protein